MPATNWLPHGDTCLQKQLYKHLCSEHKGCLFVVEILTPIQTQGIISIDWTFSFE